MKAIPSSPGRALLLALALVLCDLIGAASRCGAASEASGTAGQKSFDYTEVDAWVSSGQYEKAARPLCDGAVTGVTSDLLNRAGMGLHCGNSGQIKLALCCIGKAVEMEPTSVYLRFNLAVTYWNGGYVKEAKAECEKVLSQDPGNAQALQILQRIEKTDYSSKIHASEVKRRKVVFKLTERTGLTPRLAGSWDAEGKLDQFNGWKSVPMTAVQTTGEKTVFRSEVALHTETGNWYSAVVYDGSTRATAPTTHSPVERGPLDGEPLYLRRFPVYPVTTEPLQIVLNDFQVQRPAKFLRPRRQLVPPAAPSDGPPRTLLICVDSDTWQIVMPLVKAGCMPRLAQLMAAGSYGEIFSDPPISTIIFDRLSFGTSGTFGWFDYVRDSIETLKERGLDLIHAGNVAGTMNTWKRLGQGDQPTVYISWAEQLFYDKGGVETVETVQARSTDTVVGGLTAPERNVKIWGLLDHTEVPRPEKPSYSDTVAEELIDVGLKRFGEATELLKRRQPRVMFVHFGFVDTSFHLFWDAMDPDVAFLSSGFKTPRRHARVIENLHRLLDLFIGDFAAESWEKGGNIIVFSDHGATGGFAKSWLGHVPQGMIVAAGPSFARGVSLTPPPDISSIVPTVFGIYGLKLPPVYTGKPLPCLAPRPGVATRSGDKPAARPSPAEPAAH